MPEMTYAQLAKGVNDLAKTITRDSQAIHGYADAISEEAFDTARLAESIGAMNVDKATVAETQDVARLWDGVANESIIYASAGDVTARAATAAQDQNRDSHLAFGEAAGRSPVGRDVYDVNREWFRQE